jgi:hypothetical protein
VSAFTPLRPELRVSRPEGRNSGHGTALGELWIGIALASLGAQESGTARLEDAVTALRAALQELTRERVPLEWASIQSNLGTVLEMLSKHIAGNRSPHRRQSG